MILAVGPTYTYILEDPDPSMNGIPIACKAKKVAAKIQKWPLTQGFRSFNSGNLVWVSPIKSWAYKMRDI